MRRLAQGGRIDRAKPLAFSFDGRALTGFAGDTLASALLANGVRVMGRSFKYHRKRGVYCAGPEEPNALVTLRRGARAEPNTRATTAELFERLGATSQNRWPSLAFDAMAINQLFAPLFVAGFYYKTFMWPAAFWERVYEPLIRRAAGLGALSGEPDPDSYDRAHAFCDLLVVGAGPAGLCAALHAARAGLRVVLAEEDWLLGGRLLSEAHEIDGAPAEDWLHEVEAEIIALPNVRLLRRTSVFGAYDGGVFGAVERIGDHLSDPPRDAPRQRLWTIAAKHSLVAMGAIERPLVFAGNDKPGVMSAAAASTYVRRYAVAPGTRAAVFTTSDSGWRAAQDLLSAGIEIAAVIEARSDLPACAAPLRDAGVTMFAGAHVTEARGGLSAIHVQTLQGNEIDLDVDLLAVAGGWSPNIGLTAHRGEKPVWDKFIGAFVSGGDDAIGAAAGRFTLADAMKDGAKAAARVAQACGRIPAPATTFRTAEEGARVQPLWKIAKGRGKAFVDFQHDVTDEDIALAAREGFVSVEHLKRYTTLGMATDQGKAGQINGHALLGQEIGKTVSEVGTIRGRPPHSPIAIGVLAGLHRGENFRPVRHTPSHAWAEEQGAVFVDAGQWKRAQWYPRPGEHDWLESITREVVAVRTTVGVCDVSTLGKIDVQGPDAAALLDRLYANTVRTLPIGRTRYGLMLREDGFVLDDGTVARLGEDHFFVTTTTVNAARVMQHVDFARQALWPGLDAQAVSITEQWAQFAVAGPRARLLMQALLPDEPLSNAAFPYLSARTLRWRDGPARLFRLSFSGELGYEIAVPAARGDELIRALIAAGRDLGVTSYGTEALSVLRIEKGHPASAELNGQTTAGDLGLARLLAKRKDYIGRTLAQREGLIDPDRPALVGIRPIDRAARLRAGAHILPVGAENRAAFDEGHVTSAAYSPTLGHWIGLALVRRGPARHGARARTYDPVRNGDVEIELCDPVFIDPEGARLRA